MSENNVNVLTLYDNRTTDSLILTIELQIHSGHRHFVWPYNRTFTWPGIINLNSSVLALQYVHLQTWHDLRTAYPLSVYKNYPFNCHGLIIFYSPGVALHSLMWTALNAYAKSN